MYDLILNPEGGTLRRLIGANPKNLSAAPLSALSTEKSRSSCHRTVSADNSCFHPGRNVARTYRVGIPDNSHCI